MTKKYVSQYAFRLFPSIVAILLSTIYYISRLGFATNYWMLLKVLGLSLFIINASSGKELIRNIAGKFRKFKILLFFSWLLMTIFFTMDIGKLLAFCGYVFFIWSLRIYFFRSNNVKTLLGFSLFSILFSLWLAGIIWGSGFHNPLYFESIAVGSAHQDILFNSAIAQMIKTYHVPSTGLNLLPIIKYHWGSHWLFAQISNLLNISAFDFYQIGYPIIIIPIFFYSFLFFINIAAKYFKISPRKNAVFWLIFSTIFIGCLPYQTFDPASLWKSALFFSESYTTVLTLSFFFFGICLRNGNILMKNKKLLLLIFPAYLSVIGLTKISFLFMSYGLFLYLFIRLKLYRETIFNLLLIVLSMVGVFIYYLANSPYSSNTFIFYPFYFIRNYFHPSLYLLFIPYAYFWTIIFLLYKLVNNRITTLSILIKNIYQKKLLDCEILIVVSVLGFFPVMLVFIGGGSAFYFLDWQRWIAAALILTYMPPKLKFKFHFISIILLIGLSMLALYNYFSSLSNLLKYNRDIRASILKTENKNISANLIKSAFKQGKINIAFDAINILAYQPNRTIQSNKNYRMIQLLKSLDSLAPNIKNQSLLFIPRTNSTYWKANPWSYSPCDTIPFVAPAISGIAMINGLPDKNCPINGLGYEDYQINTSAFKSSNLCQAAKEKGFTKIIRVASYNKLPTFSDCR